MAKTAQSIAGRAHGAKPAAAKPQTKRYRPQLEGHATDEVVRAIQTAFDNTYELRDQVNVLQAQIAKMSGSGAAGAGGGTGTSTDGSKPAQPFNDNILGIKVKATTDPSSLKDGATLVYSAATGQFEFKVP
jgi:hypothetical protein